MNSTYMHELPSGATRIFCHCGAVLRYVITCPRNVALRAQQVRKGCYD